MKEHFFVEKGKGHGCFPHRKRENMILRKKGLIGLEKNHDWLRNATPWILDIMLEVRKRRASQKQHEKPI